jgi:hypothetical protein
MDSPGESLAGESTMIERKAIPQSIPASLGAKSTGHRRSLDGTIQVIPGLFPLEF